jgi:hypothetical protein
MLYVMIENICVLLAGRVFQQTVGMPMDINCYQNGIRLFGCLAVNIC